MSVAQHRKWWLAGVGWTLAAVAIVLFAGGFVPLTAQATHAPLLQAMAQHAGYLYGVAGLMALMGWIDSLLLYRRGNQPLLNAPRT